MAARKNTFQFQDGAIDRKYIIPYNRISFHVSIPKMVRLIEPIRLMNMEPGSCVSIPMMVRIDRSYS